MSIDVEVLTSEAVVVPAYLAETYWWAYAYPLRHLMRPLLVRLEPFALDLWRAEVSRWLPDATHLQIRKTLCYGGFYQVLEIGR